MLFSYLLFLRFLFFSWARAGPRAPAVWEGEERFGGPTKEKGNTKRIARNGVRPFSFLDFSRSLESPECAAPAHSLQKLVVSAPGVSPLATPDFLA